ncbi:MAG TPA: hypothetical protein VEL76_20905 [Gemmataceae bacterium]|nr:hypothetical protein [Gemmataceae bacterium]
MADGDEVPPEIRAELVRLFEATDWRMTTKAETDGKAILLICGYKPATQWGICEYIVDKLQGGFRLTETGMGEPKGSRGIGYEMKNADGEGLYIKLKIEEGEVWVISFHY